MQKQSNIRAILSGKCVYRKLGLPRASRELPSRRPFPCWSARRQTRILKCVSSSCGTEACQVADGKGDCLATMGRRVLRYNYYYYCVKECTAADTKPVQQHRLPRHPVAKWKTPSPLWTCFTIIRIYVLKSQLFRTKVAHAEAHICSSGLNFLVRKLHMRSLSQPQLKCRNFSRSK